jgi:hypothetical protein
MSSDTLKVSASFQYDRYIAGATNSFNQFVVGNNNNLNPLQSQNIPSNPQSAEDVFRASQETYTFGVSDSGALQPAPSSYYQPGDGTIIFTPAK